MVEVCIIILNWNGWSDTKECLESLYKSSFVHFHLLLVDNGSADDYKKIKEWNTVNNIAYVEVNANDISSVNYNEIDAERYRNKPSVFIIKSLENLGFAKGNNIGIRLSKLLAVPFVFLLNNDTYVEEDSLEKLVTFIKQHREFASVVPQIRYADPADTIWCCGGELNGFYEYYYYKGEKYNNLPLQGHTTITFSTGCALLLRNHSFDFLSEKFFFGEEDFELGLRFKKEHKKMACLLDAVIFHKESASIDRSSRYINKMFIHRLNRFIDIKTYAPATWVFIITYRTFKFFLLHLLIEKTGLVQAVKNTALLYKMAWQLTEINKRTFDYLLNVRLK